MEELMRISVQRQGKLSEQLATMQKQRVWLPKPSDLPFSSGLTQPSHGAILARLLKWRD